MTGAGNNTYLLAGPGDSATLIDAGVGQPDHLQALDRALAENHLRLTRVLVTHAHADHASGAAALAAAHPAARFYKYPQRDDGRYAVAWEPADEGTPFDTAEGPLRTLHTPGHSPDHLAFWHEGSRTLFSGDLVALGSSVMIPASGGGDLRQYLASLDRLRTLSAAVVLPAHGPAITNPEALLREYLAHRRQREKQVIDAVREGHDTVPSIAESIYDGLDRALMKAAHENVRAHLDKLKFEGRVFEHNERWTLERHNP